MFCTNCGTPLEEGDKFCPVCGKRLTEREVAGGTDAQDDVPAVEEPPSPSPATAAQTPPADVTAQIPPAPPAQPPYGGQQQGEQQTGGQRNISRRNLAIGAAALAAAGIGLGVATGLTGSNSDDSGSQDGGTTTGGTSRTQSLERPHLVTLPPGDTTHPAPALARYQASYESSTSETTTITNSLELNCSSAVNYEAFYALSYQTDEFRNSLDTNGFVVSLSYYDEFFDLYENNRYEYRANFVTVDSLMHTYHLCFMHLLKSTEKSRLAARITSMGEALLETSLSQYDELSGSEWEDAAKRNVAFFGVAQRLMGESPSLPDVVTSEVESEVAAIEAASGSGVSAILSVSDYEAPEDYSLYKPRGYYEGDDQLERYFRAMTWYGRANFPQAVEDLDRSACLMTLALRDSGFEDWEAVYVITAFFAGESDDNGYYEYRPILDEAYGETATAQDLVGNEDGWQQFHALTAELDPPQINSVLYVDGDAGSGDIDEGSEEELESQKGFRLMGQRFTLDEAIFEQLLPDAVGSNSAGESRDLPKGLDICAVLGSDEALGILDSEGDTGFEGYSDNVERLRSEIADADDSLWTASLYSQWLYTLNPLLAVHGEESPSFMRTASWTRHGLQTYLGSYTELKHDTVLYGKQVMAEAGGGGMDEYDDRGYVEPEPELYRRLENLVSSTSEGLAGYGALDDEDAESLSILESLSSQLATIADAELAGEALTDDQYDLIRSYGAQIEHFFDEAHKDEATSSVIRSDEYPASLVVDVATNASSQTCLELATGKVSEMYVLFELDGALHVASGGVFSYYEFEQPISDRLTDSEWQEMLDGSLYGGGVSQPSWVDGFTFTRG